AAEQAMDERAGRMARPRMHHEPGRFVDDDQVVVLVEHAKIHRLGLEPGWNGGWQFPAEPIARAEAAPRARRSIVQADVSLRDQSLHLAPALPREQAGQILVESRRVGRDGVLFRRRQARRGRPLRQSVPTRSTAAEIGRQTTLKFWKRPKAGPALRVTVRKRTWSTTSRGPYGTPNRCSTKIFVTRSTMTTAPAITASKR